jgi:RNA polymerase sigma-70 factor, ECF subfamily
VRRQTAIHRITLGTFDSSPQNAQVGLEPKHFFVQPTQARSTSDEALVAQLLSETGSAFDAAASTLYRRHSAAVFRFASMISASREIATDATQEAFVWLVNRGEASGALRFDPARGSLAALLCGVARNHVLRLQTVDARFVRAEDEEQFNALVEAQSADDALPDAFAVLATDDRRRALMAAVAALPFEFREALILVEFEEFSYEQAALTIGCPIGTIRSRLSRAKARLREALAELFAVETGNSA